MQQPELPMKDVTPKNNKPDPKKKAADKVTAKKVEPVVAAKPAAAKKKAGTAVATVAPQAPKEIKSTLQVIAEISTNPNTRPEVAQLAWNMQKEMIADQRRSDFNTAFVALQADLSRVKITRDGKIEVRKKDASGERTGAVQQATPYATFNSIMKTIQPLLTKHVFGLAFSTEPTADGRLLVHGYLRGYGHEEKTTFPLPAETSGSKNNVQGWGSSQSYGKRYCTIALLNIVSEAPEDRDTDGRAGNFKDAKGGGLAEASDAAAKVTPKQKDELLAAIDRCGVPLTTFHQHYGIEKIGDLSADLFDAAIKACDDFLTNKKAKVQRG